MSVVALLFAFGVVANVVLIIWGRRRSRSTAVQLTGRLLERPVDFDAADRHSWVGGANLPAFVGRLNATWPLARADLDGSTVTVSTRPAFVGAIFGASRFTAVPSDGVGAFPVRGRLAGTSGVGFSRPYGADVYFWTRGRGELLAALDAAGFVVNWQERRARTF